ncbi:ATP-dependent DNA helicase II subunit 1 [Sorochytrium milnesiophthora]
MYTNSITTFAALLDQMNQLEKVAVVNYQPRKGSTPRLAALVPQIEQNDSNGQVMPSGFHVVMLPFKDDLRSFAKKPSFKADDTLCDLMRPIVKKFRAREWTPTTFHNPMLQQFYSLLHAKALGREVEPIEDTTQPRYDVWNQRLAAQAKQFNDAFPAASAPVAQKRKAADGADSGGGGARKRRTDTDALPSLVTSDGKVDEDAVRRMVLDQGLMGYKVDELRAVLRAIGAGVSGSKAVLAGRIADSFSSVA